MEFGKSIETNDGVVGKIDTIELVLLGSIVCLFVRVMTVMRNQSTETTTTTTTTNDNKTIYTSVAPKFSMVDILHPRRSSSYCWTQLMYCGERLMSSGVRRPLTRRPTPATPTPAFSGLAINAATMTAVL